MCHTIIIITTISLHGHYVLGPRPNASQIFNFHSNPQKRLPGKSFSPVPLPQIKLELCFMWFHSIVYTSVILMTIAVIKWITWLISLSPKECGAGYVLFTASCTYLKLKILCWVCEWIKYHNVNFYNMGIKTLWYSDSMFCLKMISLEIILILNSEITKQKYELRVGKQESRLRNWYVVNRLNQRNPLSLASASDY